METPKGRNGSSEPPKKVSPRAVRQLKVNPVAFGSSSPASPAVNATRTPKDRSPKVPDRKSPRSLIVPEKKWPSRATELETQISELQGDLKKVKDQLTTSKASKEEAEANAEELKQQLAAVSSKLEESQKQISKMCSSKEADVVDLKGISEEKDQAWENQLETVRKQQSLDASALASALDEIETLKQQLELVSRCEDAANESRESTDIELQSLKQNLKETLLLLESMKSEVNGSKQSEAQAQELVRETLRQLEEAKQSVNTLEQDGLKANETYKSVALELENSRAHVFFLEGQLVQYDGNASNNPFVEGNSENVPLPADRQHEMAELVNLRSEVRVLKSALEAADLRHRDEQAQSSAQIKSAQELADQMSSASSRKQDELEAKLKQAKSVVEELKANLMDKENELQGVSEENESLNFKLKASMIDHEDSEIEDELERLREEVASLKANLTDKESKLRSIAEENTVLKSELENMREDAVKEDLVSNGTPVPAAEEVEAAKQEAVTKLEVMMEEAEKSKRRAARASEQLEAAQGANAELEAELRKLKVQSDQWRKAAEAAASMLSTPGGNGRFVERTGSLDNSNGYSPIAGRMGSPYLDDYDDDETFKKKNGNVLRKIGGFWKKPQK